MRDSIQGAGLGLRSSHYQEIFDTKPDVPWFEILSDNYMADGGLPIQRVEKIRQDYPITLHGVGMSLGSADPLNLDYLQRLKNLADHLQPSYVSDHLAWVSVNGQYTHDLLPLPYTQDMLQHLSDRIQQVQEYLGRTILIENPSSYLTFASSDMSEGDFIKQLCVSSGCELLLDVNNVYVNSTNHGFYADDYITSLPTDNIEYLHIAGHFNEADDLLVDTHGSDVNPQVWALLKLAYEHHGVLPTLLERDFNIPAISELLDEVSFVKQCQQEAKHDRQFA